MGYELRLVVEKVSAGSQSVVTCVDTCTDFLHH